MGFDIMLSQCERQTTVCVFNVVHRLLCLPCINNEKNQNSLVCKRVSMASHIRHVVNTLSGDGIRNRMNFTLRGLLTVS